MIPSVLFSLSVFQLFYFQETAHKDCFVFHVARRSLAFIFILEPVTQNARNFSVDSYNV